MVVPATTSTSRCAQNAEFAALASLFSVNEIGEDSVGKEETLLLALKVFDGPLGDGARSKERFICLTGKSNANARPG